MRMQCFIPATVVIVFGNLASAEPTKVEPVAAIIETTRATGDRQIRHFAFDGDKDTYFASKDNVASTDHFTFVFDKPVAVKTVTITTGRPKGEDVLAGGTLDVSA